MKRIVFLIFFALLISQNSYIDSLKVKNPSLAWKIGLIPGMGQFYNNQYIKGVLFLGIEAKLIHSFSANFFNSTIGKRNDIAWLLLGMYIFGLLDAYVEAHLSTFPIDINLRGKE